MWILFRMEVLAVKSNKLIIFFFLNNPQNPQHTHFMYKEGNVSMKALLPHTLPVTCSCCFCCCWSTCSSRSLVRLGVEPPLVWTIQRGVASEQEADHTSLPSLTPHLPPLSKINSTFPILHWTCFDAPSSTETSEAINMHRQGSVTRTNYKHTPTAGCRTGCGHGKR